jgi:hypothetical protein
MKPSSVTLAKQSDENALFELIRASDDEWSFGKPDADKIRGVIESAFGPMTPRPYFGVISGPTMIEAAIGLFPTEAWNSSDLYIRAFWQFVRPMYRKSKHAVDLRDWAKWFGDEAGLPVLFELPRMNKMETKAEMLERGAEWIGGMFMYRGALEAVA